MPCAAGCPTVTRTIPSTTPTGRDAAPHQPAVLRADLERQGRLWVNVKAEPAWAILETDLPGVVPAYHMNKRHWIGIVLDGSMTADQIFDLIAESYRLTAPRAAKSR